MLPHLSFELVQHQLELVVVTVHPHRLQDLMDIGPGQVVPPPSTPRELQPRNAFLSPSQNRPETGSQSAK